MHNLCNLRKLVVHLRHFENKLKEHTDLSLNEALCLCQIQKAKIAASTLCNELEISASRISRILKTLENKNLIKRSIANDDRRNIIIEITNEGQILAQKLDFSNNFLSEELRVAIHVVSEGEK